MFVPSVIQKYHPFGVLVVAAFDPLGSWSVVGRRLVVVLLVLALFVSLEELLLAFSLGGEV